MPMPMPMAMPKTRPALAALLLSASLALPAQAETVGTRIGPVPLQSGYPSPRATARLYDEMDFQRATQAWLWALPAVGFRALQQAQQTTLGTPNGAVALFRDLADKAGMLTPNITTLYAFSFWDLKAQGPLVVEVPAGATAGGVLDIWQRPITDMGQTGPDKGQGGKYLLLAPGAEAIAPEGYRTIRATSNQVWFATRALDPDPAKADATIRQHRLYAWADRAAPGETRFVPVAGRPWSSAQPNTAEYFRLLAELYRDEPVDARDQVMFAMLRPLGVMPGAPFKPDARQARILGEGARLGELMARANAYDKRFPGAQVYPGKRWEYANMVALTQEEAGRFQLDERGSWFYEAIGNSVGMQGRTLGFGQVYLETSKDGAGRWLEGARTYRLRVPANPPVEQFWSITLYDNVTRGPVMTPQGAADLSSRKPDLVKNADGSVDVWFGPTRPPGAANWIRTVPGRGWFPYFRLYGPKQAYFDKSWQLNDIERVGK